MKYLAISHTRKSRRWIPLPYLLLLSVCAASQSGPRSTHAGTVKDSTGAIGAGAVVTVVNTGRNSFSSPGIEPWLGRYLQSGQARPLPFRLRRSVHGSLAVGQHSFGGRPPDRMGCRAFRITNSWEGKQQPGREYRRGRGFKI